jgi:hypothetical protein
MICNNTTSSKSVQTTSLVEEIPIPDCNCHTRRRIHAVSSLYDELAMNSSNMTECLSRQSSFNYTRPSSSLEIEPNKLFKLGHYWSHEDWLRRIQKMDNAQPMPARNHNNIRIADNIIHPMSSSSSSKKSGKGNIFIHITGALLTANASWLSAFIRKNFKVNIVNATIINPKFIKKRKFNSFKVEVRSTDATFLLGKKQSKKWLHLSAKLWSDSGTEKTTTMTKQTSIKVKDDSAIVNKQTSFKVKAPVKKEAFNNINKVSVNDNSKGNKSKCYDSFVSNVGFRLGGNINKNNRYKLSTPTNTKSAKSSALNPAASTFSPSNATSKYSNFVRGDSLLPEIGGIFLRPMNQLVAPKILDPTPGCSKDHMAQNVVSSNTTYVSPQIDNRPVLDSQINCPQLDPLVPHITRLTSQSAEDSECRLALSRLRDINIYRNVRLFLAYLHNKPDSECIDGFTKTNLKILIQKEGLPSDYNLLKKIFIKFHESFNTSASEADSDLKSYASHLSSKRTIYLQNLREASDRYFKPLPSSNNK